MSSRNKASTFEQRVAWLRAYEDVLKLPTIDILRLMKRDGLIAKSTYLRDCEFKREFHAVGRKQTAWEKMP